MPWLDAAWHPAAWVESPLPLDPADRGFLLSDGVFDTSLVLGGRMVFRAAHLTRLAAHARVLGFGVDRARLDAAVDGTLARSAGGPGVLRLTLTRGPGARGLVPPADPHPTILATLAPLATTTLFAPMALHLTAIRRNETSSLASIKSLGYGDAVLAAAEARAAGSDDALFLNGAGDVACVGAGNLFAVIGTVLATPPLAAGVLDGVTRGVLLRAAASIGLTPSERVLAPADLVRADAVVCTNSLRLVAPVVSIDGRSFRETGWPSALQFLIAEAIVADSGIDPRSFGTRA